MTIRILEGEWAGGPGERAVLVDSVTEKPLPLPMFECADDARNFLARFESQHGSPLVVPVAMLDLAHTLWVKTRCMACYEIDCSCKYCGAPCHEPCAKQCRAGADLAADMRGL